MVKKVFLSCLTGTQFVDKIQKGRSIKLRLFLYFNIDRQAAVIKNQRGVSHLRWMFESYSKVSRVWHPASLL